MSSRRCFRAAALVGLAILATACTSGSTHVTTSTSNPAASSAAPSAPTASAQNAGTPSGSTPPSTLAASSSPPPANAASGAAPAAPARIVVELARSHRIGAGDAGTLDVDQLSVVGLPDDSAIAAALQAPEAAALAEYTQSVASQQPCTGPACGSGNFTANFTTSRADPVVLSGTWTISTFYPGGAHPYTQLEAVIVDAVTGMRITPAQLFVGSSLTALSAATATAAKTKLDAIGCATELGDGFAPTADNYGGTAIGRAGLLVGLSQGQVAAEACGTLDVSVTWGAVRSQLSPVGARFAGPTSVFGPSVIVVGATTSPPAIAPRCATTALDVALGVVKQVANTQYEVPMVFTNMSTADCSLLGFPGTDFGAGGAGPVSLVRTPDKPARVTVGPGDQAHAVLTYLAGPDPTCDTGGPWTPTTLTVTPPDETTSVQIPWPGGSVDDCQTGATHPGSYIGPVVGG